MEYSECGALAPFVAAGKAVFHVEYVDDAADGNLTRTGSTKGRWDSSDKPLPHTMEMERLWSLYFLSVEEKAWEKPCGGDSTDLRPD